MPLPTRIEVLRLYKDLLRYGYKLKFTDQRYYSDRIRKEFTNNKGAPSDEVEFLYKVNNNENKRTEIIAVKKNSVNNKSLLLYCINMFVIRNLQHIEFFKCRNQNVIFQRQKIQVDRSKVPKLDEKDLEEHFIKGTGPGGSKINKSVSCVQLIHKPTGIIIKCQDDRDRERNRKLARERLITKLDNLYNGEDSVESQKKRIYEKKMKDHERKRIKLLKMRADIKQSMENKDMPEVE